MEQLYRSLDSRLTPEAVCALILELPDAPLMPAQRRVLARRAAGAAAGGYTSMGEDFERPVPLEHKVRMLVTLLRKDLSEESIAQMAGDPWQLLGQLRMVAPFVGWLPGSDFRARLRRDQLAEAAPGWSRRRYNRLVRHMRRTQVQAHRLQRQIMLRQLTLVGRSGLAYSITLEEMRADPAGACFVAYWVAQRNRRRAFTLAGRDNPFDTVTEMLLANCQARAGTDWWMIARAYPNPVTVARLDDAQRGQLMGEWMGFMRLAANMLSDLHKAWPHPRIRERMVVRQGVDSSTWNLLAGAYNAARAGWINCVGAAGALDLLDVACPGKAMRLMAGDLVYMHDGDVDPDTAVWARLPPPWEVLDGDATCTAPTVEAMCWSYGIHPQERGWTAPRQVGPPVAWKPTPELVHGVEVADPLWAGLLRRAGVFSGKDLKPDAGALYAGYAAEQAAL